MHNVVKVVDLLSLNQIELFWDLFVGKKQILIFISNFQLFMNNKLKIYEFDQFLLIFHIFKKIVTDT